MLYTIVLASAVQQYKSAIIIYTPAPWGASLPAAPPGCQSAQPFLIKSILNIIRKHIQIF